MVVLSLAIGLAEQDDFANLPDLQEAPACQENQTTPEKRYWPESARRTSQLYLKRVIMEKGLLQLAKHLETSRGVLFQQGCQQKRTEIQYTKATVPIKYSTKSLILELRGSK